MKHLLFSLLTLACLLSQANLPCYALSQLHDTMLEENDIQRERLNSHLDLLWRHALNHNPSIILALEKLADKASNGGEDGTKKKKFAMTMLNQALSIGGLGSSIALGTPLPMIGSSMLNQYTTLGQTQEELKNITPTDMVLLAREISHIQAQLVTQYLAYRQNTQEVTYYEHLTNSLHHQLAQASLDHSQDADNLNAWLIDSQFKLKQARSALTTSRQILIWSCGPAALDDLDKLLVNDPTMKQSPVLPAVELGQHAGKEVH